MKKSLQTMLGVTLLEIMLVLAIASMVIVMSIRYYQSASTNQKITSGLNVVTAVVAAGESLLAATGSLATASGTTLGAYLPGGQMPNSPWGGPVTIPTANQMGYTIDMPISTSTNACSQFILLVNGGPPGTNKKTVANCGSNSVSIQVNE